MEWLQTATLSTRQRHGRAGSGTVSLIGVIVLGFGVGWILLAQRWLADGEPPARGENGAVAAVDETSEGAAEDVASATHRAPWAVAALAVMVVLMITGLVPNVVAALIACLVLGASGCIDLRSAVRAVHWPTILVLIAMLPFARALEVTGGIALAADWLADSVQATGPHGIIATLFAVTLLVRLVVVNTATAALMAPVAIYTAWDLGASPYPFALTVAIAASTAFITPIATPVNMLVARPGGLRLADFARFGLPFAVLVLVITAALVPLLLPLYP